MNPHLIFVYYNISVVLEKVAPPEPSSQARLSRFLEVESYERSFHHPPQPDSSSSEEAESMMSTDKPSASFELADLEEEEPTPLATEGPPKRRILPARTSKRKKGSEPIVLLDSTIPESSVDAVQLGKQVIG